MLVRAVEAFLTHHDMAATKFGRLAASDPRFVLDLRLGRIPRAATEARIRGWMAEYDVAANKAARAGLVRVTASQIPAPRADHQISPVQYKSSPKETAHV